MANKNIWETSTKMGDATSPADREKFIINELQTLTKIIGHTMKIKVDVDGNIHQQSIDSEDRQLRILICVTTYLASINELINSYKNRDTLKVVEAALLPTMNQIQIHMQTMLQLNLELAADQITLQSEIEAIQTETTNLGNKVNEITVTHPIEKTSPTSSPDKSPGRLSFIISRNLASVEKIKDEAKAPQDHQDNNVRPAAGEGRLDL
jgi:hypothetical protein